MQVNKKYLWRGAFIFLSVAVMFLGIYSYKTWVNYRYHLEVHQRFEREMTDNYDLTIASYLDHATIILDTTLKEGRITYQDSFELEDIYERVQELQWSYLRDVQQVYLAGFMMKDIYGTWNIQNNNSVGLSNQPFFSVLHFFTVLNDDLVKSAQQQMILDSHMKEKISLILEKTGELLRIFKENPIPNPNQTPLKERVNKRIEKLQKIAKFYNENELRELNEN